MPLAAFLIAFNCKLIFAAPSSLMLRVIILIIVLSIHILEQKVQRQKNSTWSYDMEEIGYNYRLTELNSVLGISQLQKLPKLLKMKM